jgi:hypothetical protein
MHLRHQVDRTFQHSEEFPLLRLEHLKLFPYPRGADALFESIDKRTDLALYSRQLAASDDMLLIPRGVQPVQLAVVFGSKLANERRVHQAVLEAGKHARLEHISAGRSAASHGARSISGHSDRGMRRRRSGAWVFSMPAPIFGAV